MLNSDLRQSVLSGKEKEKKEEEERAADPESDALM